jgi:hypothetical protein
MWKISLTSTPRATRSSRAAWMSETITKLFCADPGAAGVRFTPN